MSSFVLQYMGYEDWISELKRRGLSIICLIENTETGKWLPILGNGKPDWIIVQYRKKTKAEERSGGKRKTRPNYAENHSRNCEVNRQKYQNSEDKSVKHSREWEMLHKLRADNKEWRELRTLIERKLKVGIERLEGVFVLFDF